MAQPKQKRNRRKFNQDTFIDGIKGKVLQSVSIANELECRYILPRIPRQNGTDNYAGYPPDRKARTV